MNKQGIYDVNDDEARKMYLNSLINERFEHLAPDEVDVLASQYAKSETRMFEVTRVRPRSSELMDLFEDIEFAPVRFPKELIPHLRKHDVFLGTIGFKDSVWSVIHLSPCYQTEDAMIDFEPDFAALEGSCKD